MGIFMCHTSLPVGVCTGVHKECVSVSSVWVAVYLKLCRVGICILVQMHMEVCYLGAGLGENMHLQICGCVHVYNGRLAE